MNDRTKLNGLQTEYQKLKALGRDSDAARRHQIRAEVDQLSHLMGPAEDSAWLETLGGPYETAAEYDADAEIERQAEETAIERAANGYGLTATDLAFLPTDWRERAREGRQERVQAEPGADAARWTPPQVAEVAAEDAAAAAEHAAESLAADRDTAKAAEAAEAAAAQPQPDHGQDQTLGQ